MSRQHVSEEAEARLISTCVVGGPTDVYAATARGVSAEVFAIAEHRTIWAALCAIASEERTTDIASLARKLGGFATDYGFDRLARFDGLEHTSARRSKLADDVIALHRRRKLAAALASAVESANGPATEWADVWEAVEPHLRSAQEAANDTRGKTLADHVAAAKASLAEREPAGAIVTPFSGWDQEAGRMWPGDLVVLSARPGCGKTALALQIADATAALGHGVLFASLEMTGAQLVARMARQRAGRSGVIESGAHKDHVQVALEARSKALDGVAKLEGGLCILEPSEGGTLAQIEARARLMAAGPRGLRLIVIDYLQLLTPPADVRRESRERQVAEMSRRAKLMALSIGCPVLLLAQLNRESEKDARRPRLSDLRESGAIEQDADRVWFLYTDDKSVTAADAPVIEVKLLQAKCRHGQPGVQAALNFERNAVRFARR